MKIIIIFCACLITFAQCKKRIILSSDVDPLSDLMVQKINSLNTTWKAGKNFDGYTIDEVANLCGLRKLERSSDDFDTIEVELEPDIPMTFDARRAWPNCPSISFIRDQGSCGSCWAFGSAEVMSDRTCIKSHGKVKVMLSPEDILTCCTDCGFGCEGGYIEAAFNYWVESGVVTGGLFNGTGCKPYKIEPCEHHVTGPRPSCTNATTPACEDQCQPGYNKPYLDDKHFGASSYRLPANVSQIQSEIMRNGPVTAGLIVYSDLPNYKSGVYQRHSNETVGGHAVRILGWGIEKGVPYWLIANSWNTDWGDNGYFKIRRGINECGIEGHIVAGIPLY